MRASAFYQAGLAPAQRLLLREIAIEVTSGADDAAAASARQPYLFFSPALARVILPADVPAEIARRARNVAPRPLLRRPVTMRAPGRTSIW